MTRRPRAILTLFSMLTVAIVVAVALAFVTRSPGPATPGGAPAAQPILIGAVFPTDGNAALFDATTGTPVGTLGESTSATFAQPVFADDFVFVATMTAGLIAYQPPP